MPPSTDPPAFDVVNLRQVLAVRQRGAFPSGTLTLASLELYHKGFIAVLWIEHDSYGDFPHWAINATDNLGNRYLSKSRAGSGGGLSNGRSQTRAVNMFTPGLDPAARMLTLELCAVSGTISYTEGVGHAYPAENIVGGPWHVEVPLAPAPPAGTVELFVDDTRCPVFNADDIWRVIPVGQRRVVNDYALTIFSLELCRSVFVAVMRFDYPRAHGPTPDPRRWEVSDDLGRDYRGYDSSGSGGGIFGQHTTWRMDHLFRPALGPDARRLSLSIDYIGSRPPPNPDGLHGTVVGPWTFEIDLTAT